MNKIFKLITFYYVLIIIIGGAQIIWGATVKGDFATPTLTGFYSAVRFILSVGILALLFSKKITTACLSIIIESSINIFTMLYSIYAVIHVISMPPSGCARMDLAKILALSTGWDFLLLMISALVLGYILKTKKYMAEQIK
jgi:hypothetical protein